METNWRKWDTGEEEGITFEVIWLENDSELEKEAAHKLIEKLELDVSNFYDYDGIEGNDGWIASRTL